MLEFIGRVKDSQAHPYFTKNVQILTGLNQRIIDNVIHNNTNNRFT